MTIQDMRLKDPFGGMVTQGNFTTLIDSADATTIYIGKAQLGTATNATGWQIKKISISGSVTTIAWAGGTDDFVNVWDSRASYTYS